MTTDLHLEKRLKMSGFVPPTPIYDQCRHRDCFPYEPYKILFQKLRCSIMIFSYTYFCKKKRYYEFVVARFEVLGEVLLKTEDF